jgi:hypothetical protein
MPDKNTSPKQKSDFQPFLKFAAILKTCKKNILIFSRFEALVLIENVAKKQENAV